MPITFTTKSYSDITMLNDTGEVMLELMDFGSLIPGAIAANDVPQALNNLQKNLADKSEQKDQEEGEDHNQSLLSSIKFLIFIFELYNQAAIRFCVSARY